MVCNPHHNPYSVYFECVSMIYIGSSPKNTTEESGNSGMWLFVLLILAAVGAYWYKQYGQNTKLFNTVEAKSLLDRGRNDGEYIEM